MQKITEYLSKIHNLSFMPRANYDKWLTIHLGDEFNNKKTYLEDEELELITSVVERLKSIDKSKLFQSVVHFDLHRENAMKNMNGEYCILDLASTDFNYTIFDIGTFIALFCFDPINNPSGTNEIYKNVIETYLKHRSLSDYELLVLPTVIKATYASNFLIPTFLQKTNQDDNPAQTAYYQSLGRTGLQMLESIMLSIWNIVLLAKLDQKFQRRVWERGIELWTKQFWLLVARPFD